MGWAVLVLMIYLFGWFFLRAKDLKKYEPVRFICLLIVLGDFFFILFF